MKQRSLGVTALAFSAVMVAFYSQYAAVSLLLTGSVFTVAGSLVAAVTLITGAVFLGLTAAAYAVGFGLWTRKAWSWNGAIAVFATLFVTNLFLSGLASNFASAVAPSIGCIAAMVYLQRAAIRAELLGTEVRATATVSVGDSLEAAGPAH